MTPDDGGRGGRRSDISGSFSLGVQPLSDPGIRDRIRAENAASGRWLVVLDDDPTGSQSVQQVPLITRWRRSDLRWAFQHGTGLIFVLTNSRSLEQESAIAVISDVADKVAEVTAELHVEYSLISRGDSTLRGHFPLETNLLAAKARKLDRPYDVLLFVPAYIEAGRVTKDDIHYVRVGDSFLPVGETDYASDPAFSFTSSNLVDYISEKSGVQYRREEVGSVGLADIRRGGSDRVREILQTGKGLFPVVVNATSEADLEVVALGALEAEKAGVRILYRTGPSFVRALAGLRNEPPLLLTQITSGKRVGHGLTVVGSHVDLATRQVSRLCNLPGIETVELDVSELLGKHSTLELLEKGDALVAALRLRDTVLMTSREYVGGGNIHTDLEVGRTVSRALVLLVRRAVKEVAVSWIVAKGGITSSDIATEALGIQRAMVLGQMFPGMVSVWIHGGRDDESLGGLPYVIFAGNVGGEDALANVVSVLRG